MQDNSVSRLVGVLIEPTKTFRSIGERPTWGVALVLFLLVSLVLTFLVTSRVDWSDVIRQQIADSGREIPAEQIEKQVEIGAKVAPIFAWAGGGIQIGGFALMALIFWLGLKVMASEMTYKQSFSVTLHALTPSWLVAGVLTIPVLLGKAEISGQELQRGSFLLSNAASFAPEDASRAMVALLSSLDIFSFWCIALLTLGYSVVGKVSKAKAAICVIVLWAVFVGGKVGLALLGQMANG